MPSVRSDPRLQEAAKTVNEKISDAAIRHSVNLERYKSNVVRKICLLLDGLVIPDLLNQIQKRVEKHIVDVGTAITLKEQQLKELLIACDKVLAVGYKAMRNKLESELKEFALSEAEWQKNLLEKSVPVAMDFKTPNTELLKSTISYTPVRGKFVKTWFNNLAVDTREKVLQEVQIGLTEGQGTEQIVRRIKGSRNASYSDGIINQSRHNIESVVRTSVSQITNAARQSVYKANEDVIKGEQMVATLDSRTTTICMAQDGKIYPIGEGPRPPFHWGCRTVSVPVLKSWKELGIELKEAPAGTRASMNGQESAQLTYPEWLKKMDSDIKTKHIVDEALGPSRAELWRSGKFEIKQFVNQFNRPLTLKQLKLLDKS